MASGLNSDLHQFWCFHCERPFDTLKAVVAHCASTGHKRGYHCVPCPRIFTSEAKLTRHNDAEHYRCVNCKSVFITAEKLEEHKISIHKIPCPACTKSFKSRESLENHKKSIHPFKCSECQVYFATKNEKKNHDNTVHAVVCSKCGKEFKTPAALLQHESAVTHTKCQSCELWFIKKSTLEVHNEMVHRIPCIHCKAIFRSEDLLSKHMGDNHHHKCESCSEVFRTATARQEHKPNCLRGKQQAAGEYISKDTNYSCKLCGECFNTAASRLKHGGDCRAKAEIFDCERGYIREHVVWVKRECETKDEQSNHAEQDRTGNNASNTDTVKIKQESDDEELKFAGFHHDESDLYDASPISKYKRAQQQKSVERKDDSQSVVGQRQDFLGHAHQDDELHIPKSIGEHNVDSHEQIYDESEIYQTVKDRQSSKDKDLYDNESRSQEVTQGEHHIFSDAEDDEPLRTNNGTGKHKVEECHTYDNHDQVWNNCEKCQALFALQLESARSHNACPGYIKDRQCASVFETLIELINHVFEKHTERCDQCPGAIFINPSILDHHKAMVHSLKSIVNGSVAKVEVVSKENHAIALLTEENLNKAARTAHFKDTKHTSAGLSVRSNSKMNAKAPIFFTTSTKLTKANSVETTSDTPSTAAVVHVSVEELGLDPLDTFDPFAPMDTEISTMADLFPVLLPSSTMKDDENMWMALFK